MHLRSSMTHKVEPSCGTCTPGSGLVLVWVVHAESTFLYQYILSLPIKPMRPPLRERLSAICFLEFSLDVLILPG